jgi:DNA-directed RNA polymerases I, II, and III subunit RPABC2
MEDGDLDNLGLAAGDDEPLFGDEDDIIEINAQQEGAAVDAAATKADGEGRGKAVEPSQRVTSRFMTKYEKARLLGTRALQLR